VTDHEAAEAPAGGSPGRFKGVRASEWALYYSLSIAGAIVLSLILVELTGGNSGSVVSALIDGSVRSPGRWGQTLGAAAPLLLVALGTVISGRAGLINIGQEGQVLIGAAFATYFGFQLGGPAPVNLFVILLFGVIGGALWAGIAGLLRYWRGVPEVLTTLLLVFLAGQAVSYGLSRNFLLLADAASRGNRNLVSEQLPTDNRMPRLNVLGNELPTMVFVSVLLAVFVAFALAWTVWGFRIRTLGQNPNAARRAGVSGARYGGTALLIGGGFAGLAGAAMFAGGGFAFGNYRLVPGFSANIGWTGLLVALVAQERALLAIPVAFIFASLRTSSSFVGGTGVEGRVTDIMEGLLTLALLIPPAVIFIRDRRRARAATTART
jgi:ABC-type uncharacterized transport system permease subunit